MFMLGACSAFTSYLINKSRGTGRRFPKIRYQTEVESWRNLQSANIEFTMKRPREPIEGADG